MKTFTKEFMTQNCGCYHTGDDITKLTALPFMQAPGDVTAQAILDSKIPTKDKYWFFCKKVFIKEQNQYVAIGVASIVLDVFEKKYPNDIRPRKAIKAAEDYLTGRIGIEELRTARYAAAAAAAADAAHAAAADAAYAAHAAAAHYADIKKALLDYLIFFCAEEQYI